MRENTLFLIIPLILSIGVIPALPFTIAEEIELQCMSGEVVVIRVTNPNPICIDQNTAERWSQLGIAEIVGEPVEVMEVVMDEVMEEKIVYENGNYKLVEAAENIYSFGDTMASFSLVMVTDEGVIVGDPVNQNHSEIMLDAIKSITDQPIKYLIYSHNHWDHTGGGQVFKDEGVTILSHIDARDWLLENPNSNVILADEVWKGNLKQVDLGGKTLELHHFGPSHGEGMTVFYLPEDKIIFIVDIVTPKRLGFTIMPDFSPSEWERTLIEVEKLDFDVVMFGHKRALGPASEVTEVREYLQDLRAEIFSMIQDGVHPMMIPSTIQLPKYQEWEFYDEWLEMNTWRMMLESWMGW